MKAIEVATKNHITFDDVVEICKELNIICRASDTELNEHETFLVERRIESVKKRKLEDAEKAKKNKKIKLKKKVDVSNDIRKKKGLELREEKEGVDDSAVSEDKTSVPDNINASPAPANKRPEGRPRQRHDGKPENKSDAKPRYQGGGQRQQGQGGSGEGKSSLSGRWQAPARSRFRRWQIPLSWAKE
jgi:hypothetical protein